MNRIFCMLGLMVFVVLGCHDGGNAPMEFEFDDEGAGAGAPHEGPGEGGVPSPSLPEEESFDLSAPTASDNFVFVANTSRGTLAKVSVSEGAIRIATLRVGAEPSVIVTHAPTDLALVLNEGSSTVSVVHAAPIGSDDEVLTLDVIEQANRLAISPDGAHGFAWYDNRRAEPGDIAGSLTEVSLFATGEGAGVAYQLSVGINVRDIVFGDDGTEAYIVSDDGVSRVRPAEVDGDRFIPPVANASEGEDISLAEEREVLIADVVELALVRLGERPLLRMVDLRGGGLRDLELPAAPTDVDLIPGAPFAVVSMRDREEVGLLDLEVLAAGGVAPLSMVDLAGQPVGQTVLSSDTDHVLVFSASVDSPLLSVLDLVTLEAQTYNLRKGVRAAVIGPGGASALVYHSKAPGDPVAGEPEDDIIAKSYGFTAISHADGITKLVLTDADPGELTFDAAGEHAFVLAADPARGVQTLEWIDLTTFRTRHIEFDRLPEHVGVVPGAGVIFVSQLHDLGRIAFIDVASGEIREVTGFELNGLID